MWRNRKGIHPPIRKRTAVDRVNEFSECYCSIFN